jgi:hypothetical protein
MFEICKIGSDYQCITVICKRSHMLVSTAQLYPIRHSPLVLACQSFIRWSDNADIAGHSQCVI